MKNRTYSIGEFAAMNKVSTRMLRHYDKIGLLHPAGIQPNGYRCYSDEQIDTISQIKRLRSCGFLLDEIDRMIQNHSPKMWAKEAKRKLEELQDQTVRQQTTLLSLSELAKEIGSVAPTSSYGISLTMRNEINLLTPCRSVSLDEAEDAFDALFRFLRHKKLPATGCAVLLNRLDCIDEAQNQVGAPILGTYHDECYRTVSLLSSPVLSVIHYGDYYKIGCAYRSLLDYAEQNGYLLDDIFMERYFVDSSHGVNPNEYVTEISAAVKNTP